MNFTARPFSVFSGNLCYYLSMLSNAHLELYSKFQIRLLCKNASDRFLERSDAFALFANATCTLSLLVAPNIISAGLFAHDKNTSTMHLLFAIEPFMLCTNSASTVANKIFIKIFEIWLSFGPFHCLPIEGGFQSHFREALHCTLKTS